MRSPFRKDPADAETLLSSAREKIRAFKIGFVDEVEADVDGIEADDVEKDEDSESDIAEDPEIDDLGTELTPTEDANPPYDRSSCIPKVGSDNGSRDLHSCLDDKTPNGLTYAGDVLSSPHLESYKEMDDNGCFVEESMDVGGSCQEGNNTDHEDTDIDESCPGEPWVLGLMEGEYSNLSVEERLNALVALIGVATEGNTIRLVLEVGSFSYAPPCFIFFFLPFLCALSLNFFDAILFLHLLNNVAIFIYRSVWKQQLH